MDVSQAIRLLELRHASNNDDPARMLDIDELSVSSSYNPYGARGQIRRSENEKLDIAKERVLSVMEETRNAAGYGRNWLNADDLGEAGKGLKGGVNFDELRTIFIDEDRRYSMRKGENPHWYFTQGSDDQIHAVLADEKDLLTKKTMTTAEMAKLTVETYNEDIGMSVLKRTAHNMGEIIRRGAQNLRLGKYMVDCEMQLKTR